MDFEKLFTILTGNPPFPWQAKLYHQILAGDIPSSCDIPTGLGKTSIMAIWLIALATSRQPLPRRLAYVVNRRTVVDQATDEARKLRENLQKPEAEALARQLQKLAAVKSGDLLAISTLRGQYADNGEWTKDPARPAIIVGTVDMIGSRLLFSGYGRGFKTRPFHAGLLGQDTLLVHDEAHLEPAFQSLLEQIHHEQHNSRFPDIRPLKVLELTATSRSSKEPFRLTEEERTPRHPIPAGTSQPLEIAWKRLTAPKGIQFHEVATAKDVASRIADLALSDEFKNSGQPILIFVRKIEMVRLIVSRLSEAKQNFEELTGTIRGLERDRLVEKRVFRRFLHDSQPREDDISGTVYLVATSAGEVGVNISAAYAVMDAATFDSFAQRIGRINRFGEGDAHIEVVAPLEFDGDPTIAAKQQATLELLRQLPPRKDGRLEASPQTLSKALSRLSREEREAVFAPPPRIREATGILFDAWALTTVRDLPGRPPVQEWLHGVAEEWQPPESWVAWREDVERINTQFLINEYDPQELLEDYPLKPHELLRDQTERIFKQLQLLARRNENTKIWIVDSQGKVEVRSLGNVVSRDKKNLADVTILLPPSIGGLTLNINGESTGGFDGSAPYQPEFHSQYDVADEWLTEKKEPLRLRFFRPLPDPDTEENETLKNMRLIRLVDLQPDADELDEGEDLDEETQNKKDQNRYWLWFERAQSTEEGSKFGVKPQLLEDHSNLAKNYAASLTAALALHPAHETAIVGAAHWHDLGKNRPLWQRSIGNHDGKKALAKSGRRTRPVDLGRYRHEFGSLLDLLNPQKMPEFATFSDEETRDLLLHTLATHHGRGRPHFPREELFDPDPAVNAAICHNLACDVIRRYARLQRKYGRWGLAWLESLVRAADILASLPQEDQ